MERRIVLNEDDTHFFFTRSHAPVLGEAEIRAFIRQYEGTQVSEFMLCCAGQISGFPSGVRECWLDKYDQRRENGSDVDYREHPVVRCAHRLWREQGVDLYAVCLDELRKIGISPWLSVRMNDCHDNDLPASFLHTEFFYAHPEYRRVTHREPREYFDRCLDYAQPAVRERMLAYLEELLTRYDTDGLELDFQREIFCFKIGYEWQGTEILNGLLREIRQLREQAARRWGHPVKLCVRTLTQPQAALDAGHDVHLWAREGLVDMVVPAPRWETTDSDIPVEMWKRLLEGTGVLLAPGIEVLQRPTRQAPYHFTREEHVRALAAQFISFGADRVYLFNYMDLPDDRAEEQYGSRREYSPLIRQRYGHLLRTVGSRESALAGERRHVVTYTDIGPAWFKVSENTPLPLRVRAGGDPRFVRVRVGEVPEGAQTYLRLGMEGCREGLRAYVNSSPCTYLEQQRVEPGYTQNPAAVYRIPDSACRSPFMVVELIAEQDVTVDYVEIHVVPPKAGTGGEGPQA